MSLLVVEMFAEEGDILVELVTGTEEDRIRIDFGHATVNVSVPEGDRSYRRATSVPRPQRDRRPVVNCKLCHRETDRAGWRFDQLCEHCDYCHRYSHVRNPCSRCGFPDYERPPRKMEVSD